jgi:putative ABC transport system ATP-binding protein
MILSPAHRSVAENPVIELENVSKNFSLGAVEVHAVRDFSLRIASGEFVAITGPSGSGKTTILNLVGCLDVPSSGTLRINGIATSALNEIELDRLRSRSIGFIFQHFNLVPVLNVEENVMLPLHLHSLDHATMKQRTHQMLESVGLRGFDKFLPDQLSGGQRQRVSVARALVIEPSVVLADEATANLDSANAQAIIQLMRELNHKCGTTFIFSTHDHTLLHSVDRLIHIRDGVLQSDSGVTGKRKSDYVVTGS